MFAILSVIEEFLVSESGSLDGVSKFKFYKNKKKHKVADYICCYYNCQSNPHLSCQVLQNKCLETTPFLKEYLTFQPSPHGMTISLNRILCYLNVFREVSMLRDQYGHNDLFNGKIFHITLNVEKKSDSITQLRLKLVKEVLCELLMASGGCFIEEQNEKSICVFITSQNKKCNDTICILVGPVIDDSVSSISNIVTVEDYQRLRKEEINSMCEHKLPLNEITENSCDLIRTTVLFDLLQSNICRRLTLRLFVENIDLKTSCKGSLFVMYNYVRFSRIIETFNEGVEKGKYPPLPSLSEVDFTHLTDDEWALTFNYLLEWPSVVKKGIGDLLTGRPKIHLIFNFLTSLALQSSQYYHRTRILIEPRSHLLPILFARIYLIKSLNQVFCNCFKILNVTPLIRM